MRDEIIRYLIGVLLGALIGAIATWQWAHHSADQILTDWTKAAQIQSEAERRRHTRQFKETIRGILADRARLWDRMAAGWRPTIPTAPGMPPGRIPQPPAGTDGPVAPGLPAAAGAAAEVTAADLKTCTDERARLMLNGQETMLLCQRLQGWVAGVGQAKPPPP